MNSITSENFSSAYPDLPGDCAQRLDRVFGRLYGLVPFLAREVRTFCDATGGNIVEYLPDGITQTDKDYYFIKTDVSGNTVTITATNGQLINGSATKVLAAQYASAYIIWSSADRAWFLR